MAEDFLRRWSRLKHKQVAAEKQQPVVEQKPKQPEPALPPVDKLTPDSDFTAFMQPKVEDALRRTALKKLFSDPRFNVPDPFEPYSRDWNAAEPISEEMLKTLNQARTLLFSEEETQKKAEAKTQTEAKEGTSTAKGKPGDNEPGRQDA